MKIIYCDGSSLGNPGLAGFGVVALDTERKKIWEFGGHLKIATNNQAELHGLIYALNIIIKSFERNSSAKKFELRLDSQYVIKGSTEWIKGWQKNGWKNSQKKEVENRELWENILALLNKIYFHKIDLKWTHVYGHTGELYNERVDEIAKAYASKKSIELKSGSSVL
jgi:ribonuclease HI